MAIRGNPVKGRVSEGAAKLFNSHAQLGELVMEPDTRGVDESELGAVAHERRKLGNVADIVAGHKVDVLALGVVGIEA